MRYRMSRLFPDIGHNERGMTLVEMLIGMLVLSLIVLVVTGWMAHWNKSAQIVESSVQSRTQGETALRILREDLRSGIIIMATGSELVFRNGSDEQIRYYLSDRGNLIRSLNSTGASVITTGVKKWYVMSVGERGVQVTLAIEHSASVWEREAILSARRWKHE